MNENNNNKKTKREQDIGDKEYMSRNQNRQNIKKIK